MIHTSSVEQKFNKRHIILTYELLREQNASHMTHIPPILRLLPMEYFFPKYSDATVYNYSK